MTKLNNFALKVVEHTPKCLKTVARGAKAHAPGILIGVGCVCIIGGVAMTIAKSKKAVDTLKEHEETINLIDVALLSKDGASMEDIQEKHPEMTTSQIANAVAGTEQFEKNIGADVHYAKAAYTGVTIATLFKIYAPAFALICLGIVCFLASNKILKNRQIAASAALALTTKAYDDYRNRVAAEVGKEKEKEIYEGMTHETVAYECHADDGNVSIKTRDVTCCDLEHGGSQYSVIFDESCGDWTPSALQNLEFVRGVQNDARRKFAAFGELYLQSAYEGFGMYYDNIAAKQPDYHGIDPRKDWQSRHVGWRQNGNGDNCVIFYVNGTPVDDILSNRGAAAQMDPTFRIDFNVDGEILDTKFVEELKQNRKMDNISSEEFLKRHPEVRNKLMRAAAEDLKNYMEEHPDVTIENIPTGACVVS